MLGLGCCTGDRDKETFGDQTHTESRASARDESKYCFKTAFERTRLWRLSWSRAWERAAKLGGQFRSACALRALTAEDKHVKDKYWEYTHNDDFTSHLWLTSFRYICALKQRWWWLAQRSLYGHDCGAKVNNCHFHWHFMPGFTKDFFKPVIFLTITLSSIHYRSKGA